MHDEGHKRDPQADKHVGPDRSSPYAVSRLSGPVSLVDVAREIERANSLIASTSSAKLEQIAEQMRVLREQAERVLVEARQNAELHRAEARFQRHPGKTYHLYERAPGERYWSMLSPSDWGGRTPHAYVGSFRLEADQSWTPMALTAQRDRERAPLREWFARGMEGELALGLSAAPHMDSAAPSQPGAAVSQEDIACESSSSRRSDPTDPA